MRALRGVFKAVFWLLIVALLLVPLYLIYRISNEEMRQYDIADAPVLLETAYGQISGAFRTDIHETVSVRGSFTSNSYAEMNLNYKRPELIHWFIEQGSEIEEGQVIGTYKGEEIYSTVTGIVMLINAYNADNSYLRVLEYEPLVLRCALTDKQLSALKSAEKLTLQDGRIVEINSCSHQRNPDNTTTVELAFDAEGYAYGQVVESLKLETGRGYPQALVVDERCVYQKSEGEDSPWFVRRVTEDGYFIDELEVKLGYRSGSLVCISGIEEGMLFDMGYKAVAAGDSP